MLVAKAVTPSLLRAQGEKMGNRHLIIDQVLSNVADASAEFLETLEKEHARIQKLEESYSRHGYESVSGYGAPHGSLKRYRLNLVRRGSSTDREYPYTEFDVVYRHAISPLEDKDPELFRELSALVTQSTDVFMRFYLYRYMDIKRLSASLRQQLTARLKEELAVQ
jgi:hypothetical protein